jgi:hypothetical protein
MPELLASHRATENGRGGFGLPRLSAAEDSLNGCLLIERRCVAWPTASSVLAKDG